MVVDGRLPDRSEGATLTELASIMDGLGCRTAYNLDGGESSAMFFNGTTLSISPGQNIRDIQDAVLVGEFKP